MTPPSRLGALHVARRSLPRLGARASVRGGAVRPRGQTCGLSLIELLVSVVLGLVVVGAVLYVFMSSKGSFGTHTSTARVQESGRFAIDTMLHDVRATGFIGCASRSSTAPGQPLGIYQIASPPIPNFTNTSQSLVGNPSGWVPPSGAPAYYQGDILEVRVPTTEPVLMVAQPNVAASAIYLANNCGNLQSGQYALVSSCTAATVLRVMNTPASSCPANRLVAGGVEVDHGAAGGLNGNAANAANPTSLVAVGQAQYSLSGMPSVQGFDDIVYYVGTLTLPNLPPRYALYRYSRNAFNINPKFSTEEVIDHVENLQIFYGVATGTGVNYQAAAAVQAAGAWGNVVSVRISLLVYGDDKGSVDGTQLVPWGSANQGTAPKTIQTVDNRYRQVFTATAALRDRLQ